MIRRTAGCLALLTQLCALTAHAQDDEGPSPVHVKIFADSTVQLRVMGLEAPEPTAQCAGDCSFWALPGRYTVYSYDHTTGARHELKLRVHSFGQYRLIQGNGTVHDVGVALEVVGVVVSSIGCLTVLAPFMNQEGNDNGKIIGIGLGILASGLAVGVIGFGMESNTRTELVPDDAWSASDRPRPSVGFGLVPISAGLALGALGSF